MQKFDSIDSEHSKTKEIFYQDRLKSDYFNSLKFKS